MRVTYFGLALIAAMALTACATKPYDPATLRGAKAPAWSLETPPGGMTIALSPAGSTLRLAGSYGLVVGASVNFVINDGYRENIEAALKGYDAQTQLEARLRNELNRALGGASTQVSPLTSSAGFSNEREAENGRRAGVARNGGDVLLDLRATHGLFGPEATLAAKVEGKLVALPDGKRLWADAFCVTYGPVYANDAIVDPTKTMKTDFGDLRLSVDERAVQRWTANDAAQLKADYPQLIDEATAALLCSLGLEDSARGRYALGVYAMREKDYATAEAQLAQALKLEPDFRDAQNVRAINIGRNGQTQEAVAQARALTAAAPDYAPGWFTLAWFLAETDAKEAAECYQKARNLGAPQSDKLEKRLKKIEK